MRLMCAQAPFVTGGSEPRHGKASIASDLRPIKRGPSVSRFSWVAATNRRLPLGNARR